MSVLGPILFVINDMPDGLLSEIFLIADDTKIFKENKQKRDCDLLQNDLNFMQLWTDIYGSSVFIPRNVMPSLLE